MDIKEFAKGLDEEALFYLSENNNSRSRAFTNSIVERLKEQLGIENYTNAYDIVRSNNGSVLGEIYGYAISGNGEVLTLIYSLYNDHICDGIVNVIDVDFQSAANRLQGYYQQCLNGNVAERITQDSALFELSELLYTRNLIRRPGRPSSRSTNNLVTVRLLIISNSFIKGTNIKKKRIIGRAIQTEVYDISKLYQLFNTESDHQNIDIVFGTETDEYKYEIPYIEMQAQQVGYKCFMTMFPGKLLKSLYQEYNTNLLLNNVRYFLGFKGSEKNNANIGIQKTLRKENYMFLAYNNGIVALANDVETKNEGDGVKVDIDDSRNDCISTGVISAIRDFQIVNGGQTTAALFNAKCSNDGEPISLLGVYVPVKIIVINEDENRTKEIAANITKYSNSQSKVKYADFSASNPYNMAMQDLSRRIHTQNGTYWYYERLRGQYDQELSRKNSREEQQLFKSMYDKKERFFRKELLAKVWKCYQDTPYDVVKGEGTNYDIFLKYVVEKNIQPDEEYYKKTVGLLILWNFIYNMPDIKNKSNARAPLTAYTLAYMLNNRGKEFDLLKLWNDQSVDYNLIKFILELSAAMFSMLSIIAEESQKTILSCSKSFGTYDEIKRRGVHCDYSLIDYYFK